MGHKGVSKRKLPKAKLKPLATANRGSGAVSSLAQPMAGAGLSLGNARPLSQDYKNPVSGSKKRARERSAVKRKVWPMSVRGSACGTRAMSWWADERR